MAKGRLIKVFPGGNTAYGFYSFYDHIIEPDAARIFVIKGGQIHVYEIYRRGHAGAGLRCRVSLLFIG